MCGTECKKPIVNINTFKNDYFINYYYYYAEIILDDIRCNIVKNAF